MSVIIKKILTLLEMIQFKHTVFALPFAFMGAFLAAQGVPDAPIFGWVILAMVGARTCAMGFNRIVDRTFDSKNPRTVSRALPAKTVRLWEAWLVVVLAGVLFFFSCYNLNRLTFLLAPFALSLTLFYSFTKRFTWFCHIILGVALAFSPLGGWIAVTGSITQFPFVLSAGVLFWVAGFDAVYACLDADFDRRYGLHSLPARFGRKTAFKLAVFSHIIAFALFFLTGIVTGLNFFYYVGIAITAAALLYQHFVVNPQDLSRIQLSFFTMNGMISLTLFIATWLALATS